MRVIRLDPSHRVKVAALLEQDARANLFPLLLMEVAGFAMHEDECWYGAFRRDGALEAVVLLGGRDAEGARLAVPWGRREGLVALGASVAGVGGAKLLIGPRAEADALDEGMGLPWRLRYQQRMYAATAAAPGPRLRLRVAGEADLELATTWAAEMSREDLGEDPRETEPEAHSQRTRRAVRDERVLLGEADGKVVFKVDVGLLGSRGALVGGTYVPPEHRGRGHAAAGMRATVAALLPSCPVVSLHVNEANRAAVRVYEQAGFHRSIPFRLCAR